MFQEDWSNLLENIDQETQIVSPIRTLRIFNALLPMMIKRRIIIVHKHVMLVLNISKQGAFSVPYYR